MLFSSGSRMMWSSVDRSPSGYVSDFQRNGEFEMWKARVGLSDIVFPVMSPTGTSALLGLTRGRTLPQDVKYSAVTMFRC